MVTYQKHDFNLDKRVERRRPLSNDVFFFSQNFKTVDSFLILRGFDCMTERLKSLLMNSYMATLKHELFTLRSDRKGERCECST